MAETSGNFGYTVVEGDSLKKIAAKLGLEPAVDSAREIWEHPKNRGLHSEANMQGRTVRRQVHMGSNRYRAYSRSMWREGERAYDDPHQIILYAGETIWIPEQSAPEKAPEDAPNEPAQEPTQQVTEDPVDEEKRIPYELSDYELIEGFRPELCKKYDLIFPVYKVRMEKDEVDEEDVLILTGKVDKDAEEIIYKKTLVVKDHKIENNQYVDLHFVGTPKNFVYTLVVEPGPEEVGDKPPVYTIFENQSY